MRFGKRIGTILWLVGCTLVIFSFQNCSEFSFSSLGKSSPKKLNASNNGGPYEGKPGIYVREVPGYTCEGQPSVHSQFEIKASQETTLTRNYSRQCNSVVGPLPLSNFGVASINGDILGYSEGVYINTASPLARGFKIEAFCQSLNSEGSGEEVVVKLDGASGSGEAHIFQGQVNGDYNKFIVSTGFSKYMDADRLSYSAQYFQLDINLNLFSAGQPNVFVGELKSVVGGVDIQSVLECRTANEIDPVIIKPLPGTVSKSFGANGRVTVPGGTGANVTEYKPMADGTSLVSFLDGGNLNLSKINQDGTPDTGFGINGFVSHNYSGQSGIMDFSVLDDGSILAVGNNLGTGAIFKLNKDGSKDLSFGNGGVVPISFGLNKEYIVKVFSLPNGNILLVGRGAITSSYYSGDYRPALAMMDGAGRLVKSFGDEGKVVIQKGGYYGADVNSENDIIIGSAIFDQNLSIRQFLSLKVNGLTGSEYLEWGEDGKGYAPFEFDSQFVNNVYGIDSINLVKVLSNDKILVAGRVGADYGIARYLPDGRFDPTFGIGGSIAHNGQLSDYLHDVVELDDGRVIVIGGHSGSGPQILRVELDGSLELDFGSENGRIDNATLEVDSSNDGLGEPHRGYVTREGKFRFVVPGYNGIYIYEINL